MSVQTTHHAGPPIGRPRLPFVNSKYDLAPAGWPMRCRLAAALSASASLSAASSASSRSLLRLRASALWLWRSRQKSSSDIHGQHTRSKHVRAPRKGFIQMGSYIAVEVLTWQQWASAPRAPPRHRCPGFPGHRAAAAPAPLRTPSPARAAPRPARGCPCSAASRCVNKAFAACVKRLCRACDYSTLWAETDEK